MHRALSTLSTGIVVAGLLAATSASAAEQAIARMTDAEGHHMGIVELTQTPTGVLLSARLEPLEPGMHAVHIHETGKCDAAEGFKSAGGHFAMGHQHGFHTQGGPHPGDMPNVYATETEMMTLEVLNTRVSLVKGGEGYLLDGDGSALVVHAGPDDYKSQPAGAAGDRVACGVIEAR